MRLKISATASRPSLALTRPVGRIGLAPGIRVAQTRRSVFRIRVEEPTGASSESAPEEAPAKAEPVVETKPEPVAEAPAELEAEAKPEPVAKAPEKKEGAMYIDELKSPPRTPLSSEMKDKLRDEYIGLGGAEDQKMRANWFLYIMVGVAVLAVAVYLTGSI